MTRCMYSRGLPTHCKHGHELSGENLQIRPTSGQRCCKRCSREYYEKNRDRILNIQKKEYSKRNREELRVYHSKHHLWVKYRMLPEDKQAMWVEQQGLCHICGRSMESCATSVIDHNHYTNIVRGLAHDPCNTRMGTIECLNHNDPDTLWRMFKILGIER
jgi:Recombination endonuclease VII